MSEVDIYKSLEQIGFDNTATVFSKSDTSKTGGKIGWVEESSLSPVIVNEIKTLKKCFTPDYIYKKNIKWVSEVATDRLQTLLRNNVEMVRKMMLKENPLYLIEWPSEKEWINNYIRKIESENRRK